MVAQGRVGFTYSWIPYPSIIAGSLRGLGTDIRSAHEPLKRSVQQVMIPSIQKNFEAEGRPPWQELAEATISSGGGRILDRSGHLKHAMTALARWTITRETATIQGLPESVWYGIVHQAGGGNVPARPFVMFQPEDETTIHRIFEVWLGERIAARGFGGI